jgi:hypothetical protein
VSRRRPRYVSFLVSGGLVGLLATAGTVLGPGAGVERRGQLFFYLGVLLMGIGALLGGLVAVLLEGRQPPRPPEAARDAGETRPDP